MRVPSKSRQDPESLGGHSGGMNSRTAYFSHGHTIPYTHPHTPVGGCTRTAVCVLVVWVLVVWEEAEVPAKEKARATE